MILFPIIVSVCLLLYMNNDSAFGDSGPPIHHVKIIVVPNISPVIVDKVIYLPQDLPSTFNWQEGSWHSIEIPQVKVTDPNGERYTFSQWNDLDTSSKRNVRVVGDFNYVAIFSKGSGFPTGQSTSLLTFDTYPRQSGIIVDGKVYLPTQLPSSFEWVIGSVHTVSVQKPIMPAGEETRYAFSSWDDLDENATRIITVVDTASYTALYETQYLLKIDSQYGNPKGQGWYASYTSVPLSTEPVIQILPDKQRAAFVSWSEGEARYSNDNTIMMDGPKTVFATWKIQYFVNITSEIIDDSRTMSVSGTGWYDDNSQVLISSLSSFEPAKNNHKYKFHQWIDTGTNRADIGDIESPRTMLKVTGPASLEALYDEYWFVKINSSYGNPSGEGYYRIGDIAKINVTSPFHEVEEESRWVFNGWKGESTNSDQSQIQVDIAGYRELTATWKEQFYLKTIATYPGVIGAGWYDKDSIAHLSTDNPQNVWSGDYQGRSQEAKILMDGPHVVKATVGPSGDSTMISYSIAIMTVVIIIGFITVHRMKPELVQKIIEVIRHR